MESAPSTNRAPRKRGLTPWIFALAVVNFMTFGIVALSLGGDACNGMSQDGHYYLANRGRLTEVSAGIYVYSFCHGTSTIFTHLAALIAAYGWISSIRSKGT